MPRFLSALCILFCLSSPSLQAQTSGPKNLKSALQQLGIQAGECYEPLVAEKVLPYAKDQSVLVIPRIVSQEEGLFSLDAYILLMDHHTGRIRNSYYESNAWSIDADKVEAILIDTAPYLLRTGIRAFGIRAAASPILMSTSIFLCLYPMAAL